MAVTEKNVTLTMVDDSGNEVVLYPKIKAECIKDLETFKVEITQMVIESLGGNPIFGYVDEDNNIIVQGNLADGTYSVKYEMEDGSTVNIGNLVLAEEPAYTNVLGNYTHHLNKRYSSSSGGLVDCNGMLHMYVPMADVWNKTIRFKGLTDGLQASSNNPSWFATNDSYGNLTSVTNKVLYQCPTYSYSNGIMSIAINNTAFGGNDYSHAAYLTVTVAVNASAAITEDSLANIIMTIDEEITD